MGHGHQGVPNNFLLRIAEKFLDLGICYNEKLSNYDEAMSCFGKAAKIELVGKSKEPEKEKINMISFRSN